MKLEVDLRVDRLSEKVIFEGFLLAESIERFFSFHFLVSQHHTSDVKSLGLVMLEEVKR